VIGKENGNFCLSFYGESQVGGDSEVVQNNYTVNSTFPNLTVGMPQTFYQTTELEGTTFIASTDFGKADYSAGQINFKSNDPGASGLGYDCQEIVEDDHSSLTPMPISTLFNFDVSLASPSSQIQIPFREDKIDYGINYITSYIKNNNYVAPLYSCSTGTITLEDFDYFEADDAQSVAGDNNLREFEGQFQSYGFFEADAQVFRGPAGISSEELNGTYLKSGLFSVFY
jgi:hypothetical protein